MKIHRALNLLKGWTSDDEPFYPVHIITTLPSLSSNH
jgi:hypothetical protein